MTETSTLHQLRDAFRKAFQAYTHEGFRMRDLLISTQSVDDDERRTRISREQERVRETALRYEQARAAYVSYVLAGMSASGGAVFP